MTHNLKSFPQYFAATIRGLKRHELRANPDTGPFAVGDILILNEYDPATSHFTGETCEMEVTYISPAPQPWLVPGYSLMSIVPHQQQCLSPGYCDICGSGLADNQPCLTCLRRGLRSGQIDPS